MSPHVCSLAGLLARVPVCLLQARLEQLDFVKDVHPERQITRALLAADGDADGGRGGDGSLAPCGSGKEPSPCVAKRPGRLQTRPTFSLDDNVGEEGEGWGGAEPLGSHRVANDTHTSAAAAARSRQLRWRRRQRSLLQAGGGTLASILQADKVWAQGFRGQGVKMGVFDTGIRGNHPNVNNIV